SPAVAGLRGVWIFHPGRLFVDANLATGAVSDTDACDGRRFHLQCTAIDLRDRSTDRGNLDRRTRRLWPNGNDRRHVLYSRTDRGAFLARDEGTTTAGSRHPLAAAARGTSAAHGVTSACVGSFVGKTAPRMDGEPDSRRAPWRPPCCLRLVPATISQRPGMP